MTAGSLATALVPCVLDLGGVGRRSAQAAAALTVGGAVTLGVFFTVGQPWGTINDWLSIGLAGATVPIAFEMARRNPRSTPLVLGAGVDAVGVVVATTFTSLLISGRMTFEESLPGVLAGQALMGGWLVLVGSCCLVGSWGAADGGTRHHRRRGPDRDRGWGRDRWDGEPDRRPRFRDGHHRYGRLLCAARPPIRPIGTLRRSVSVTTARRPSAVSA